ncbi:sulfite exporter TauE/SafE family protein [Candidatus Dependentiae bacterium]|nr:sulfite exporter TauE/SafE family protein [Candidatus Dependentiae bacterium]
MIFNFEILIKQFNAGFMLGLSMGIYCLSSCGICVAGYLGARKHSNIIRQIILFLSGRAIIYLIAGFSAGYIGNEISSYVQNYKRIIFIISGMYLFFVANRSRLESNSFPKSINAFFFGILSGIQPCAPFLTAFSVSVIYSGIFNSLVLFSGFYIASSLILLPAFIPGFYSHKHIIKKISVFALYFSAVTFIFYGIYNSFPADSSNAGRLEILKNIFKDEYNIKLENKSYYICRKDNSLIGTVLFTDDFVPENIRGYNGKVPVMIFFDSKGKIEFLELLENNETQDYIKILYKNNFFKQYANRKITETFEFKKNIDGYTGATVTANAVNEGINYTLKKYLKISKFNQSESHSNKFYEYIILITAIILTGCSIYFKSIYLRYFTIIYSIILFGFVSGIFLSINDITVIFSGGIKFYGLTPELILMLLAFTFLMIKGKIYCAYLCPFGGSCDAGHQCLERMKIPVYVSDIKCLKYAKFFILLIFLIYFLPNKINLNIEPFNYLFSLMYDEKFFLLAIIMLVYSMIDYRFYCRYICPLNSLFDFVLKLKKII